MIGFRGLLPAVATLAGKTLELKLNGGTLQTITFDGTTPIIDEINAVLLEGQAYLSSDTLGFFLRSDIRSGPTGSVDIVGGTALVDLGLTVRLITEKSEDLKIATVPAAAIITDVLEYEDLDGVLGDWYRMSACDSLAIESQKTQYRQPIESTGALCILEGIVVNLQGARVPDVEVRATVQIPPEYTPPEGDLSTITTETITCLTGPDGRFHFPVLQGALVHLEIKATGLSRMVTVPEKSFEFIGKICVDLNYRYPLTQGS